MSKVDDLRAMREARYEQRNARAPQPTTARAKQRPVPQAAEVQRPAADPVPPAPPEPREALCGHRAISGRTCTREQGHSAKSHRYS